MEKAKRARKAETPRQPSLRLRLRAPYLYPDPTATLLSAGAHCDAAVLCDEDRELISCSPVLTSREVIDEGLCVEAGTLGER
jgi:hypothetical protein